MAGYWSDGTANVDVAVTLRNDGQLALNTPQSVTLVCPLTDCGGETSLALEGGFGPVSAEFALRLPMGRTALEVAYGGEERLTLDVDVPKRILGVDREVWDCYSDRRPETDTSSGCFGGSHTVEKWLNDVPIKVWATGDARHIDALRQVLDELGPMMRAEFEWVETEEQADFRAHVGISRSEAPTLGFSPDTVEYWGFASTRVSNGEVLFGYIVVWLEDGELRDADIRSVIAHESMHALLPTGHPSRPVSIIGKYPDPDRYPHSASLNTWSPMDRSLMDLNYHPLVRPGMSMEDVREVIVLAEELLDRPPKRPVDGREALWRAYIALEEAGTATFKLSGGFIDRECNWLFGRRRGPIEWTIGRFHLFEQDPGLTFLDIHTDRFIFGYSRNEGKWIHWRLASSGAWEVVERSVLTDATHWVLSSRRLHRTIRSLLSVDGDPEDIAIQHADGNLVLSATMDASRIWNTSDWGDWDGEVFLELVVNPETFTIRGFTLEERKSEEHCRIYREVGTDGQIGVTLDVPADIKEALGG